MRVRVWNAFASNNSGSYSIVGSFPSADVAEAVAGELLPLVRAHHDWARNGSNSWEPGKDQPLSPFGIWAAENGLHWDGDAQEEWPYASGSATPPGVIAAGHHVLVHEAYTVTMPKLFGEYFYRRGGRVSVELDHTHHPLVAVMGFYVKWDDPEREAREYAALAARESLDERGSPLRALLAPRSDLVVRERGAGGYAFQVAAVFSDLVAGVAAARELARNAGVVLTLALSEAWSYEGDPLEPVRSAWEHDKYW